jgi:hypothetical protein
MLSALVLALGLVFFRKITICVLLYFAFAFFIVLKQKQLESLKKKKTTTTTGLQRDIKNNHFLQHYHPALYHQYSY